MIPATARNTRRAQGFFLATLHTVFMVSAAVMFAGEANAQGGGNAAVIANLRGQIQRYGCNLPQYASSVEGCRSLHARVRALQSGGSSPRSQPQRYGGVSGTRPAPAPRYSSGGGGFFNQIFGGGSRTYGGSRYSSYGNSRPGGAYSFSGWGTGYAPSAHNLGGYRTVCVRTCDGYYWPMSYSTTRSGISRDAHKCASSCAAPARLFYHSNQGADVEHMVDLKGQPYSSLENAFRYREEYVQECRCKPEPWSEAAQEEYERRAEQEDNPDNVNTAANEPGTAPASRTPRTTPVSAYQRRADSVQAQPYPEPQRNRRPRYRPNSPAVEGRWWAGSW